VARDRVQAFLGIVVPKDRTDNHTSSVPLTWLRQTFGHCPAKADDQAVTYHCRAWILHLFGCVLFLDTTGDNASCMFLPFLTYGTPLESIAGVQ
jgi:hypothetical protein